MKYTVVINGHKSNGYIRFKSGKFLWLFSIWGKRYWCGDYENLRKTKKEAFNDMIDYWKRKPILQEVL